MIELYEKGTGRVPFLVEYDKVYNMKNWHTAIIFRRNIK